MRVAHKNDIGKMNLKEIESETLSPKSILEIISLLESEKVESLEGVMVGVDGGYYLVDGGSQLGDFDFFTFLNKKKSPLFKQVLTCFNVKDLCRSLAGSVEEVEEGTSFLGMESFEDDGSIGSDLVLLVGGQKVIVTDNGGEIVIGRSSQNADVIVKNKTISRRHALLKRVDGSWLFGDLGSSNGSWVNGVAVKAGYVVLNAGDEIVIGNEKIRVVEV